MKTKNISTISKINEASPSFDFLSDEPDLYSISDLKVNYKSDDIKSIY